MQEAPTNSVHDFSHDELNRGPCTTRIHPLGIMLRRFSKRCFHLTWQIVFAHAKFMVLSVRSFGFVRVLRLERSRNDTNAAIKVMPESVMAFIAGGLTPCDVVRMVEI